MAHETITTIPQLESIARNAWSGTFTSDYKPGHASAEVSAEIKEARENANFALSKAHTQQQRDAIAAKLEAFERKISAWYVAYYRNLGACPSAMIVGPANFPVSKKNRQIARDGTLNEEYRQLQNEKDALRGTFNNFAISSSDPEAVKALKIKLERLEGAHNRMKAANEYFRKNKTLIGCPDMSDESAREWQARHDSGDFFARVPFASYSLSNNNAEIKRVRDRIAELEKLNETTAVVNGWEFDGGRVEIDKENGRIGIYFDERTSGAEIEQMRRNEKYSACFPRLLWSSRFKRWQAQLTDNNLRNIKRCSTFAPTDEAGMAELAEAAKIEQEKREEAKRQEEAKKAAASARRESKIDALMDREAKLPNGFKFDRACIAYANFNTSQYMEAGHGIRRWIMVNDTTALIVEIYFKDEVKSYRDPSQNSRTIICEISEHEKNERGTWTGGSGYMCAYLPLEDYGYSKKRSLNGLAAWAGKYSPEEQDAQAVDLYEAYKAGTVGFTRSSWMDCGNVIPAEVAKQYIKF